VPNSRAIEVVRLADRAGDSIELSVRGNSPELVRLSNCTGAVGRCELTLDRVGEWRQRHVALLFIDEHGSIREDVEGELVAVNLGRVHRRNRVPFALARDPMHAALAYAPDDGPRILARRLEPRFLQQTLVQRLSPPEQSH
jgi:hypothetical protein